MISSRQWRKVLVTERLHRACREAGGCTDSKERSWATLGGKEVLMARCAKCGVRFPA